MINLGDVAQDTITGFKGVVIGVGQWLYGCRRISIQPEELKDGKPMEHVTFDEPQLRVLKRADIATAERQQRAQTGGPRPEPTRRPDLKR